MPDLIAIANGKLDDPIMLEWALRHYDSLPKNAREARTRIESTWFHDLFIAQLIERDETELLSHFFRSLPAKRFANLTALMVQRWPTWPPNVAGAATGILAANALEDLLHLFEEDLQRVEQGNPLDTERYLYADALAKIATDERLRAFFSRLCPRVLALSRHDLGKWTLLSMLLEMAGALSDEALETVLDAALRNDTRQFAREGLMKQLVRGLFGHAEYFDLVVARGKDQSRQRIEALGPFFSPGAPLAMLDEWIDSLPAPADLLPALPTPSAESSGFITIQKLLKRSKTLRESFPEPTQTQIALAACIHGHALDSFDATTLDLEATVDLLAADLDAPRWHHALFERLCSFSRHDIVAALTSRLPVVSQTYGAVQLATAMGDLGWEEFVPLLIDAMAEDQGDFLCESAKEALVEIGAPAQSALIGRWPELDRSQQIFGLSVIRDVGGTDAADFAIARFDELLSGGTEDCCEVALAAPDPRLLDRLRPELRRRQPLIDRAYYIIGRLLGQDEPEVRAAGDRALEDSRKRIAMRKAFDAGNISHESLSLELRCPACGDVNRYDVKGAIVPSEQREHLPYLVNDEFPCASCGQDVEFEFTPMATIAVSAELMLTTATPEIQPQQPSRVSFVECRIDGGVMSLAAGLAKLRDRVSRVSNDARAWFQMGNLLSYINRPKATVHAFRQTVLAAPQAVDAKLTLARLLASGEADEEAFTILTDALDHSAQWQFIAPYPDFGQEFADLYNYLRRRLGKDNLPALHPASLTSPRKTGRNDPCPCGSGKKYKKCCGG